MYTVLSECPLFKGLTPDKIEEIMSDSGDYSITEYHKGDYIAHKDTAYSGLMIMIRGKAYGEMAYSSGKRVRFDAIASPQLIAPAFLFGGYNKLPFDVIAQKDVTIMTLHRGYVFELMQANPIIMSNFIDIISNRANVWSKRVYFLSFHSLKEKVVEFLLERIPEGTDSMPMPDLTEITEFFDTTRSALTTVLKELEKKHLISLENRRIAILNRKGLQETLK